MAEKQNTTQNISVPNKDMEVLKKNFSHCFDKDGNFDFDKFKKELSKNEVNFSKESYSMDWLGKSYARLLASDNATTLLKEDEEFNGKEENKNSENLLIKGDNLEILKHLSNAYYEKVKMIYIDPPYNTGGDGFVYQDDRKFTVNEFSQLAGVDEDKAKRVLNFVDSNSNSHSAWLTFMYPRLYIAKQLLKDDGVIFISIDENESSQLKLLCDEIFGEENLVGLFCWKNKYGAGAKTKGLIEVHEYIFCYSKRLIESIEADLTKEQIADYNKKKDDKFSKRGGYVTQPLMTKSMDDRENLKYNITHNEEIIEPRKQWVWEESRLLEAIKNDEVVLKKKKDGEYSVRNKVYLKDENGNIRKGKPITILNGPFNQEGTKEVDSLLGSGVFKFPKPTALLKYLLSFTVNGKAKDDDIFLDFFAGSGTTGDAVMQLNAKGEGNSKFILVQLPEKIDKKNSKTAYDFVKDELQKKEPTIFEITKERLIRVSDKIKEDNKSNKDLFSKESKLDLGFKIFETTPIWEDYNLEADEFDKDLTLFDETKLSQEDLKALLITWKTNDGIALTDNLQEIDLDKYIGYYFEDKLYLMDKGFKTKSLKKLLELIDSDKKLNPASIIAFGYHFDSKSLREVSENIKSYANKKNIDIDFITRY
jgi:adenine-specific DNA-methyltransferase